MTKEKLTVKNIGVTKTSKNGNKYSMITLSNDLSGLFFFKEENIPLQLNNEYEFEIRSQENGVSLIKIHQDRKTYGRGVNNSLEALKLAVQLVCADKVNINQLKECQERLKKMF